MGGLGIKALNLNLSNSEFGQNSGLVLAMLCNCLEAVAARGAGREKMGQDSRKTTLKQPSKLLRDPY